MKCLYVLSLAGAATIMVAAPALAQQGHQMPGMKMPAPQKGPAPGRPSAKPVPKKAAPRRPAARRPAPSKPAATKPAASGMQGMAMPQTETPAGSDAGRPPHTMPGMEMPPQQGAAGTALPPGNAPAPAPPADHYADGVFSPANMARARDELRREHGGGTFHLILFNLAEYQARNGSDGFRWDGEAWIGGDINRLTLKSEGEGAFRGGVESAEIQVLYSRALDPYWNLQAGVRHDFKPNPSRTYATIGIEGLAPYWFEVEGALFLSDKGDVLGRLEGYYDQRITQRLILQPRVELNFAAQDMPENRVGSGLSNAELGLRLRYEVAREFAPYIGLSYERTVGDTRRFRRDAGQGVGGWSFVMGVRTWF